MTKKILFIFAIFYSSVFAGGNVNTHQPFSPFRNNTVARLAGLPQSSYLVFKADLSSSITPEIGTGGTFARASSITYGTSASTFGTVTSGNPAIPAFAFGGGGIGSGYQVQGTRKNYLYQSETFTNLAPVAQPWVNAGTFSVDQSVGSTGPDGLANVWQLTSTSAGAGKTIDTLVAAASKSFVASVYVRVAFSGTIAGSLVLEGTAGSETVSKPFTATTTWQRVFIPATFTGAAVGNCTFKFLMTSSGNALFTDNAQVEYINDSGVTGSEVLTPSPYIPSLSGTATASSNSDDLSYPSSNISAALTTGSISVWANTAYNDTQKPTTKDKNFLSMNDFDLLFGIDGITPAVRFYFGTGGSIHNQADTWTANVWRNYIVTWDNSTGTINSQLYKNGVLIATNTTTVTATPAAATFNLGSRSSTGFKENYLDGILYGTRWWRVKLSSSEALQVYNLEKVGRGL